MKVIADIPEFRKWRATMRSADAVPFVPTMGALHEGHASLVRQARQLAGPGGKVMASIFVNPTQFGPHEDFTRYPRTLDADVQLLTAAGCDVVFVPSAREIYPVELAPQQSVAINPGPLADILEGAIRPGHFHGVCTVVAKLLNIVQPTHLFLGQKDFQQQLILRRMCLDLNMPVQVATCPTLREMDGLAMSSRNRYLSQQDRPSAAALFKALQGAKEAFTRGELQPAVLEAQMRRQLEAASLEVQYATVRHAATLAPWPMTIIGPCAALLAVKLGTTRLIDNLLLNPYNFT